MASHHPEPPGSGTARPESTQVTPQAGEHASVSLTSRLRVRDVMSRKVSTLHASEALPLEELLKKFRHVRHLPVIGANSRLVGMVTRMDVLEEALVLGRDRWVRVRDLLSCPVESISEDEGLPVAARAMRRAQVHSLPVVDESRRMVGILTDGDLLSAMAGEHLSVPGDPWELPVDMLMTHEPYALGPDATLEEAAGVLIDADVRHLPVVDEDERLVGILSERDLRERLGGGAREWPRAARQVLETRLGEVMTPDPISLRSGEPVAQALEIFTDERVGAIPVVEEEGRLLGILSYIDLLRWLRERSEEAREREGGEPPSPH
ncbi:CBS domain-containing protein [Cystobacter ferrugineus]|nr:CBS domain-containing protein [Cystobacter ferrugineus]